jgi:hypothetical protein
MLAHIAFLIVLFLVLTRTHQLHQAQITHVNDRIDALIDRHEDATVNVSGVSGQGSISEINGISTNTR